MPIFEIVIVFICVDVAMCVVWAAIELRDFFFYRRMDDE